MGDVTDRNYDFNSIMHYPFDSDVMAKNKNKNEMMKPIKPSVTRPDIIPDLSKGDVYQINEKYQCSKQNIKMSWTEKYKCIEVPVDFSLDYGNELDKVYENGQDCEEIEGEECACPY